MFDVFVALQKVELVGGSWLEDNSGSALLAVAAVAAASLAASVAILNVKRQLANDQRALREQLEQDRLLHNRDQTRDSVDAAVGALNEAVLLVHSYVQNSGAAQQPAEEEQDSARAALYAMRTTNAQLRLRFGEEHEIVETHEAAREALQAMFLEPVASAKDDDEKAEAVGNAFRVFREACHVWFRE